MALETWVRDHYLGLETKEAEPLDASFSIEKHVENTLRLTLLRREYAMKALRRELERRGQSAPRFLQPFAGAVILRDGEPFWGRFWVEGDYKYDESTCDRAQRIAIERAHAEALRLDAYYTRRAVAVAHIEALKEDQERSRLDSALRASVRYHLTKNGHEALAGQVA